MLPVIIVLLIVINSDDGGSYHSVGHQLAQLSLAVVRWLPGILITWQRAQFFVCVCARVLTTKSMLSTVYQNL